MLGMGSGKTDAPSFAGISSIRGSESAIELDHEGPDIGTAATLGEHTIVRMRGLLDASALNGKCARVQNFVKEHSWYTVSLLDGKGATMKQVPAVHLETLSVKEEVEELLRELHMSEVKVDVATHAIFRLRGLPMDLTVLKETQIGKHLNNFTKPPHRLANNDIFANLGRNLVKKWREQFQVKKSEEVAKQGDVDMAGKASSSSSTASASASTFNLHSSAPVGAVRPQLVAVPGREDSLGDAFVTVDLRRCLARIWNNGAGGQCSKVRPQGKDFCGTHAHSLPHGRMDGVIPGEKQLEYQSNQFQASREHLINSVPGKLSVGLPERLRGMRSGNQELLNIPAISSDQDAKTRVGTMRNAPTDRIRLSMLMSLDRTNFSHLPSFVAHGGLSVLEKWIRDLPECRFACLTLLPQLPLDSPAARALLTPTLTDLLQKDVPAEVLKKARDALDVLNGRSPSTHAAAAAIAEASRVLPAVQTSSQASVSAKRPSPPPRELEPPAKAKRLNAATPELVAARPALASTTQGTQKGPPQAVQPVTASSAPLASAASAPRVTGASAIAATASVACPASPNNMPEEVKGLDPRIQAMLLQHPAVMKLMQKHPALWQNFNKDSIARLVSLLKRSQESEKEISQLALSVIHADDAALRTITLSDLPMDATKSDVEALFDEMGGSVEVVLPMESRKKKHVGIAYALVADSESAQNAVNALDGSKFRAAADPAATVRRIRASVCARPPSGIQDPDLKPVSWKSTDELWELQMYNKELSVHEGCKKQPPSGLNMIAPSAEARAQFQQAARREREDQARLLNFPAK